MPRQPLRGLFAGVKHFRAQESGNHRFLDSEDAALGAPFQYQFIRQTVQQVDRGRVTAGETREIHAPGGEIQKGRPKTGMTIVLADAAAMAITGVFFAERV